MNADRLLSNMSKFYQNLSGFYMRFSYQMIDQKKNIIDHQEGQLWIQKKKYHLKFPTKVMMCDGKTQWVYDTIIQEVTIHHLADILDDFIPTQFYQLYQPQKYTCQFVKTTKDIVEIQVTPKKKHAMMTHIIFIFKIQNNDLQSWTLYDHQKNSHTFTLQHLDTKIKYKSSDFHFKVPKDVALIDLRY